MTPHEIMAAADRIKVILAGHESPYQAAILADVVAMWLAGHLTEDPEKTSRLRAQLLDGFNSAVKLMMPSKDALVRAHLKDLRNPRG